VKNALVLAVLLLFSVALATTIPAAFCQDALSDALSKILSNPITFLIFLVQFGLGFGLGYLSMKVLKYIIAIICILILGVLLNIWQFGGLESFLQKITEIFGVDPMNIPRMTQTIISIISLLGILTILPIGAGFFIGVIVAARR